MVNLNTSDEWQHQTSLLLQARPTTTRITTKYKIPHLSAPKYQQKLLKRKRDGDGEQDEKDGGAATHIPRATLTLKTYDPESGVVLKFKTDRAAEVGRLIHGLGRVGRHMAALPEKAEDIPMEDAPVIQKAAEVVSSVKDAITGDPQPQQSAGGSKKKKKNKK
ncbi:hypothetical protein CLAFUW4_02824 [Fulvia fulva]|uniref:SRP9 domain-containing protein n=1 Tax=Passalora fulva TaxID=5499 RepID=A0A9Q8L9I1_PASFU|nr:uncharacterized protein CLAFUR5_02811 [Fulvia fulva]KAK4632308.1 hypothetical protein CLAFUR4_02818 [Fulvia fulva]KAK4633769.1 hypothetical protein CLAFUR0_02820 [Fulvia fulva]UJO13400.1 hypothetical protein CLAFUR5_02811 [Fulvia fulva]WPV11018.1 hypothetical protein CLAFUW4_02824 [Fulvia fulva]WPV26881.1 hypothetical protein CLAFUW7_02822 [Fulvia fulva]